MNSPVWCLKDLIETFSISSDAESVQINGLYQNSMNIKPGALFFACQGETVHGKKFIAQVIESGAVAIALETGDIAELETYRRQFPNVVFVAVENLKFKVSAIASRFFGEPSRQLSLIGITGTNGKTSCAHLLAQCLHTEQTPCGVIGTLGAGIWGQLVDTQHTTPNAIDVQKQLYEMIAANARYVVMEVSSHALLQGRVKACEFNIAAFTNLSRDHLDYHGDMHSYGNAKLKLFQDYAVSDVVVNLDDDFSRTILNHLADSVRVFGCLLENDKPHKENENNSEAADILTLQARVRHTDNRGLTIIVTSPWGNTELQSALIGDFNVSNLMLTLACLLAQGIPFELATQKLATAKAPAGRLETFRENQSPLIVVDYAHTPDALEKTLVTLRKYTDEQLLVLFGCGGDRDNGKRALMGEIAERLADQVWITDDNPRTEDSQKIIADILTGIKNVQQVNVKLNRAEAIREIVQAASNNDIVLIAGKGHEDYQIIGTTKMPFSDRELVASLVKEAA